MLKSLISWFVKVGLLLSLGGILSAQDPQALGTTNSPFATVHTILPSSNVSPTATYTNASYSTGGVALRNRRVGAINISGVGGSAQAAWVYWAVLLNTTTIPTPVKRLTISRLFPKGAPTSQAVVGTLIATGGDPCWGSTGTYVYRAPVSTAVVNGNGTYKITLKEGASGLVNGADPWAGTVFPLFEGASLVVVGQGSATVALYDAMAGATFSSGSLNNYYQLPAAVGSSSSVLFDAFGYDGQLGDSRFASLSNEVTTVFGWPSFHAPVKIAGPGGEATDSDFDGTSGFPLPQLWDDTGHNISNAFNPGDTWVNVDYAAAGDCIGPVGAVISVQ